MVMLRCVYNTHAANDGVGGYRAANFPQYALIQNELRVNLR